VKGLQGVPEASDLEQAESLSRFDLAGSIQGGNAMVKLASALLIVLSFFVLALILAWRRLYWLIVPHGMRAAAPSNLALSVVSWVSITFLLIGAAGIVCSLVR
jgi:hypothetical protein